MFAGRMLLKLLVCFTLLLGGDAWATGAKIEEVGTGTLVKVSRAGSMIRLKKGDPLQSGDEVNTDADTAVDIRLEDDTLIRVGVNSSYKIQEEPKVNALIHRLLSGVVRVLVPKSESKTSDVKFRMYTPEGTIGVRGTEFVVIRSAGRTQLKGLDGEVMFGAAEADFGNAGAFTMVNRGFHSEVGAGAKPDKPAKFDLPKYLQEINGQGGQFGPLAARGGNAKVHARSQDREAPAPVVKAAPVAVAANKPEPAAKLEPKKKPVAEKVNWQNEFLTGAYEGDLAKVKQALEKGAHINGTGKVGYTALQMAMSANSDKNKDVVIFLIKSGASVNVRNKEGLTPLMLVAKEHLDMEYAKALVYPGGADINALDKDKKMAQDIARDSGYTELADYLSSTEAGDDAAKALEEKKARKKNQ